MHYSQDWKTAEVFIKRQLMCWLGSIYLFIYLVNLTQSRVIWEEEILSEGFPPLNFPVGKSM